MKIKTSIVIGLGIILTTVVSIFLLPSSKAQDKQSFVRTEIPVVIKPLKTGENIVPVDIQCEKVFITKPDTLDGFTCTLINKTNKNITASSVRYSIIVDSNGKEEEDSRLDTAVPYIHPDLLEVKRPIEPAGKLFVLPSGPIVESGSVIKSLELEPIYIEFSDGTTVGVGGESAEMIASVREGAASYKNSLRQEYLNKGKNTQAILSLLEDDAPLGSEIENFNQQIGAKAYRRFLRKKYEQDGITSINEVLNK